MQNNNICLFYPQVRSVFSRTLKWFYSLNERFFCASALYRKISSIIRLVFFFDACPQDGVRTYNAFNCFALTDSSPSFVISCCPHLFGGGSVTFHPVAFLITYLDDIAIIWRFFQTTWLNYISCCFVLEEIDRGFIFTFGSSNWS